MNDKSQLIKQIISRMDLDKVASYPELPKSKTLRQIIRYSQRIQESNNDQEIFKLAVDTAYNLDTICDPDKAGYIKDEEEKKHYLEISKELFENTVGLKNKK